MIQPIQIKSIVTRRPKTHQNTAHTCCTVWNSVTQHVQTIALPLEKSPTSRIISRSLNFSFYSVQFHYVFICKCCWAQLSLGFSSLHWFMGKFIQKLWFIIKETTNDNFIIIWSFQTSRISDSCSCSYSWLHISKIKLCSLHFRQTFSLPRFGYSMNEVCSTNTVPSE